MCRNGEQPGNPTSLGADALCTVADVGRALGATCLDVGELILSGRLPSVMIPRVGRRVKVGDLRRFIRSLPADDEEVAQ